MHRLLVRARNLLVLPTENLLARFVALNVLGKVATNAIGFVASIALARWLAPADRGLLALMVSIATLALILGGVGLPWATVYYSNRKDVSPGALLGNSLVHAGLLALLIPLAWLFDQQLADAFGHGQGGMTWVLAAALVPITFLDWTTHGQLQGMLLFGRYNALSVLSKIVYALGVLVLVGALGMGVAGGVIATGALSVVMVLGALKPILAAGRLRFERRLMRAMLHYGARVQAGSIFQTAMARLDVVILQFFRPLSQVGYYVIAQTIAELVLELTEAFKASVMPLVSHYEGDERQASTSADSVRHHGLITGVATLANVFFGSAVILLAYGSQYRAAVVPMIVLLPGVWFLGLGGVIQSDLSGRGRPGASSKLAGVAAVVTLVLDFALIPPFGVIGAALASVIAYTTYGVASLIMLHRISGIPVRRLLVPTREDIAAYRLVVRRMLVRLRPDVGRAA
ncbi:MAG TPA: oligosaccharide flippase family protein [Solirubrobacteraceae bacterium]|jgi:O-antigen/teichoic acid export membrane protein|nr:oligosaccharide flippase family protein [Solirubrobacteraceae bacterium]